MDAMTKKLLIILGLVVVSQSCSLRDKYPSGVKGKLTLKVENYENEKIKSLSYFRNKKLTGYYYKFYMNGNIQEKSTYVDGILNGQSTKYYDNGNIMFEVNLRNGMELGKKIAYYPDGAKKGVSTFCISPKIGDMDSLESISYLEFPDSTKMQSVLCGEIEVYYQSGNTKEYGNYYPAYFEKTEKSGKYEYNYVVFVKDGEWIYYHNDGSIIKREEWNMGILISNK